MKFWALIGILLAHSLWAGDFYVFAPSFTKSNQIEKELSTKIQSLDVHAYGRFSDFKAKVLLQKPAAILAPYQTIKALGFENQIRLWGTVNGLTSEPLVLMSIGNPIDLNKLSVQMIGLVAVVDRPALKSLMEDKLRSKPKANPVTKLEDLLPMLTFESANAIMITASEAKQFQDRSEANLVVQSIPGAQWECLVLAVLSDEGKALVTELERLPKPVLELLSLEGWKR
jgi:hypothetical protein